MKEVCDVGMWKPEEQSRLPDDITVNMILSRLPVKDLLRFRAVCKQWNAIISDPRFAEIHLQQQYKNLSLIAWDDHVFSSNFFVGELRNNCFKNVSPIEFVPITRTLCSCDGLYLGDGWLKRMADKYVPAKYVLWNPSNRMYRELYAPVLVDYSIKNSNPFQGMYYDPLMKDYKIVTVGKEHYAVYSCRDNKWGDVKETKIFFMDFCQRPVFANGSIYWMIMDYLKYSTILCFDCKDESFKTLGLPNITNHRSKIFQLILLGGQLCILISHIHSGRTQIMKRVGSGDEWMESKEECLCEYRSPQRLKFPEICQLSENEILLIDTRRGEKFYTVYDKSKNTLVEINDNQLSYGIERTVFKHVENLLLL